MKRNWKDRLTFIAAGIIFLIVYIMLLLFFMWLGYEYWV